MDTPAALEGTGEEWKAIDSNSAQYRPDDALLARCKGDIERYRKRDVRVRIVDRSGQPVAHLPVEIIQQGSDFPFGDQLWGFDTLFRTGQWHSDTAIAQRYQFSEIFNAANALTYWTERPANDGPKTEDRQGEIRLDGFGACVDWAAAAGLIVKGHPLFWSIPKAVPDWVKRYDYATQMKFAEVRVRNLVARFKGKVKIWDAVNEALWEPAFENLARREWPYVEAISAIADYVEPVLRWCREEDPDACFVVNDYGMESDPEKGIPTAAAPADEAGSAVTAARQRVRMLKLVGELRERGAPPSAIGLQSHTGSWQNAGDQLAVYDELGSAGLPLHVTEFTASTSHLREKGIPEDVIEQMVADYTCNTLTVAFSHRSMDAFFCWGMRNDIFRIGKNSSQSIGLIYGRLRELLRKDWFTTVRGSTDAEGQIVFRGFTGDYSLRYPIVSRPTSGTIGQRFCVTQNTTMPVTMTVSRTTGNV